MKKYSELPEGKWENDYPLATYDGGTWFYEESEIIQYCLEEDCTVEGLELVLSEPNYYREVDPDDYYYNSDCEDEWGLPKELEEAFAELNKVIRECKEPQYYSSTDVRLEKEMVEYTGRN